MAKSSFDSEEKSKTFWDTYSRRYDTLMRFSPYRGLVQDVVTLARLDGGKGLYLDAGCGTGNLLALLKNSDSTTVIGLDHSLAMIEKSRQKTEGGSYILANLDMALGFKGNSFDVVVSSNVLAYVRDVDFTLSEFYRVLKPGGRLILTTLRRGFNLPKLMERHIREDGILSTMRILMPLSNLAVMNLKILAAERSRRFHFFSKMELRRIVERTGFSVGRLKSSYAGQSILISAQK